MGSNNLKTSGSMTNFGTGATRDALNDKSRMELIPYECIPNEVFENIMDKPTIDKNKLISEIMNEIKEIKMGNFDNVDQMIINMFKLTDRPAYKMLYELGFHYGLGADKYCDNNFRLGQRLSHVVGSMERHMFKFVYGWDDESPHERGMLWNAINVKFIALYHKDNPNVCDLAYWYKDGKPNFEYFKKLSDEFYANKEKQRARAEEEKALYEEWADMRKNML